MNQHETATEWLARKKAGLGRLQGNHRVPSSSSLERIGDMEGSTSVAGSMAEGNQEKVTNEILNI